MYRTNLHRMSPRLPGQTLGLPDYNDWHQTSIEAETCRRYEAHILIHYESDQLAQTGCGSEGARPHSHLCSTHSWNAGMPMYEKFT